jgi:hypothetical protein
LCSRNQSKACRTLLHKLLPVAAVAREAGDLPGGHSSNLAQAHLRDHALEAGAQGSARGRTPEVLVDYLDLRPAELQETITHGVLQPLALAIVLHLMNRGLADVEHRLADPVLRADLLNAHRRRSRPAPQ